MKIDKTELSVWVDCDDTLICHGYSNQVDYDVRGIYIDYYGTEKFVLVHEEHVQLVKAYHARGFKVIVHSNNGALYAAGIVKKLGLEKFVHEVKTKPTKLMDDQDVGNALGARVYIPFSPFKKRT